MRILTNIMEPPDDGSYAYFMANKKTSFFARLQKNA